MRTVVHACLWLYTASWRGCSWLVQLVMQLGAWLYRAAQVLLAEGVSWKGLASERATCTTS